MAGRTNAFALRTPRCACLSLDSKYSIDLVAIGSELFHVVVFAPTKQRSDGPRGRGGGGNTVIARLEGDVQPANEEIAQRERHLLLDRVVQLGDDVRERWNDRGRESGVASDDGPHRAPARAMQAH